MPIERWKALAAVMALSVILATTAFAAGDIGTISYMYVDGETASCIEQAALSEMFNDAQHITSNRRGNQRGIRKESGRETAKSGEKTEKAIIQTTV